MQAPQSGYALCLQAALIDCHGRKLLQLQLIVACIVASAMLQLPGCRAALDKHSFAPAQQLPFLLQQALHAKQLDVLFINAALQRCFDLTTKQPNRMGGCFSKLKGTCTPNRPA
jgi:hypothetical protein